MRRCSPVLLSQGSAPSRSCSSLLATRIDQAADGFDRDGDDVTVMQKHWRVAESAHSAWRAGGDHVAWLKRERLGAEADDPAYRVEHRARPVGLHFLAVNETCHAQVVRI